MDIMFEIVSRQKYSANFPTMHVFGEAGGYIGRSEECEWVIPDHSKQISRKHALITFEDGDFFLEDVSSNGVFLSLGNDPLARGQRYRITHGEGFVIGGYTVMARLLHNPRAYTASAGFANEDILSFSTPLSLNPLTAMDQEEERIARERLGEFDDLLGQRKPKSVLQPPDHSDPRISTLLSVVAVPEQQAPANQRLAGTRQSSQATQANQFEPIPEDWDDDPWEEEAEYPELSPFAARFAGVDAASGVDAAPGTDSTPGTAQGNLPHAAQRPVSSQESGRASNPENSPASGQASSRTRLLAAEAEMANAPQPASQAKLGPQTAPPNHPQARPENNPAARSKPANTPAASSKAESGIAPEVESFFRALGFAEAPASPAERERVLTLSAKLLGCAVDGLTRALHNRNECKNELRLSITTTSLGVSNNPLKFSPTPEAALDTLLGHQQKGVLPPLDSMREAFANLHSHHMGLMAGARAAVRASLDKVAPQAVEARLDANGPVRFNRKGRLWHTLIRMHQALRDDHDGFAALFLEDFARAYEVQGRTLNPVTPANPMSKEPATRR